jgi:hypothetical protein
MTPYAILPDSHFGCQCKYPVALVVKHRILLELSDHAASREHGNTLSGFMEAIARQCCITPHDRFIDELDLPLADCV